MSISRCNKCGTISEHDHKLIGTYHSCEQCQTLTPIHDTIYFVSQLLKQYFAQRDELHMLRVSSEVSLPPENQPSNKIFDIHNSNLLSSEVQHQPILSWFFSKNITTSFNINAVDTTGFFDEAAVAIGADYPLLSEFCERIRYAQQKEFTSTLIHLDKKSAEDAKAIELFAQKLYKYSLIARCFSNKSEKNIRLVLQNAPSVRRFFAGEWLEWFVLMTGLRICQERKVDFSCARNLTISFLSHEKKELDVFFLINKSQPIYIECKTGEFRQDIDKYVSLRKRLGIDQKCFILCVADLDTEQSKGLSAMHGLTFVNIQTLGHHLTTII